MVPWAIIASVLAATTWWHTFVKLEFHALVDAKEDEKPESVILQRLPEQQGIYFLV